MNTGNFLRADATEDADERLVVRPLIFDDFVADDDRYAKWLLAGHWRISKDYYDSQPEVWRISQGRQVVKRFWELWNFKPISIFARIPTHQIKLPQRTYHGRQT